MSASFTPAQIERFKREAKQLHRTSEIPHSQALDLIAGANGYRNWSLLMKHSDTPDTPSLGKPAPQPLRFTRTPELMRLALRKVPTARHWGGPDRDALARQQVEDISRAFVSPQNAVTYAIDYMQCLLTVPRFKIYSDAPAYWEMRLWLPYRCEGTLVNRAYKPVGQVDRDAWANYADFPHLHVQLTDEQCRLITAPEASPAYLFNDGCAPWYSRADAAAYLERLRRLRSLL